MLQSRRHGDEYIFPNGAILIEFAFTFRTITQASIFFSFNAFTFSKREREAFLFLFTYAKQSPFDFSIVVVLLRVVFSIWETKSAIDRKQEKEKKQLAAFVI